MSWRAIQLGPYGHKHRHRAFADGIRALGGEVVDLESSHAGQLKSLLTADVRFAFTSGEHDREIAARTILAAANLPLVVLDCGYLRRNVCPSPDGYSQLGLGGIGWTPFIATSGDRFEILRLPVAEPARNRPKAALVLGQVPNDSQHHLTEKRLKAWLTKRADEYRALGFEIFFRPHPKATYFFFGNAAHRIDPARSTLAEDLSRVAIAIAYNSTAGVEALMAGVPVVCSPKAHYAAVAGLADRAALLQYLHRLAYAQWTCDELRSGEPLRFLARFAPLLPKEAP